MTVLSHLLFLLLATFLDFPFEDPCFLCSCGPFQNPEIRTRLLAQNQSTAHSFHHSNCVTLSMTSRMNFRAFFFFISRSATKGAHSFLLELKLKENGTEAGRHLATRQSEIEGERESHPALQTSSCPGASRAYNLPMNVFFFTETSLSGVTSHLKLKNLTEITVLRYL